MKILARVMLLLASSAALAQTGPNDPAHYGVPDTTPTTLTNKIATSTTNTFRNPLLPANRVICFGDSHCGFGWNAQPLPTSAGTVVISGGVLTVSVGSSSGVIPGNRVLLWNYNDASMQDSINGASLVVTATADNTHFTASATVCSPTCVTTPDGDYSSNRGGAWWFAPFNWGTDSGWLQPLDEFAGMPLQIVGNFGMVSTTAAQEAIVVNKAIYAGPHFDIVSMDGGTNGIVNSSTQCATVASTQQQAQAEYQKVTANVLAFLNAGKRVQLIVAPPVYSSATNAAICNSALLLFRKQLVQFAQSNPGVVVEDLFKDAIDGTSTVGSMQANYNNGTDYVHLSSYAETSIARYEATSTPFASLVSAPDSEAITVLDDAQTYSSSNAVTAWASGQTYTVPTLRLNGGNLYQLVTAGPGTTSGSGPAGYAPTTGSDGYVWAFANVDGRNIIQHGLFDLTTGGTNQAATACAGSTSCFGSAGSASSPTGTPQIPTGWSANSDATCTGILLSKQTLTTGRGGNSTLYGYGFTANLAWTGAGHCLIGTADDESQFVAGQTYVACMTITALANFTNIKDMYLKISPPVTNNFSGYVYVDYPGNNATTQPMKTGDVRQMCSVPFKIPTGSLTDTGAYTMALQIDSTATGAAANFQISNARVNQVIDPGSY